MKIQSKRAEGVLLSVIVPVYNVKPYLKKSIASILNQTYQNIEVILINDGSMDGSEELCREYAGRDSRVRLLCQENQGVARARRNGLQLATGEYITFVDPDDYIDGNLFQQMMECRDDFDLVVCRWYRESEDSVRRAYDKMALGAYRTREDMDFLLDHMVNASMPGGLVNIKPGITSYLWNKLYKTALAKEIYQQIDPGIRGGEDMAFTYLYLLRCESVLISDICGYHYQVRSNSIAHGVQRGCGRLRRECDLYDNVAPAFMEHPRRDTLLPQLQLKLSTRIARRLASMEFAPEARLELKTYVFPFLNMLDGKRVVLYGAGTVGRHYWRQLHKFNVCGPAVWTAPDWRDCRREGLDVSSMEALTDSGYDFVVIAELEEDAADGAKERLISLGVAEEKILWRPPLEL